MVDGPKFYFVDGKSNTIIETNCPFCILSLVQIKLEILWYVQEPSQPVVADTSRAEEVPNQTVEVNPSNSNTYVMTEEQKARMEANRLRALERAAARALSKQA